MSISLDFLLLYPKTVTALLLLAHIWLHHYARGKNHSRSGLPLPPGPPGYPIIGNMFDIPFTYPERAYADMSERYGDLIYLESMGTRILVICSQKRTRQLFDSRSSIYSSRAPMPMLGEIMGYEAYFSLQPYGPAWRRQRQIFHDHFNPTVIHKYHFIMLDEVVKYVQDLLNKPKDFSKRTRSLFTTIILRSMYGIQPSGDDDPFITNPAETVEGFSIAAVPGSFFVDIIPALKYVPDWMPGTGWKKFARYYRQKSLESRTHPFQHVREQMRKGVAPPSALRSMLEDLPEPEDPRYAIEEIYARDATALGYVAGSDTSLSTARAAFALLALHPAIQKRAQAEIDKVVGSDRLPNFSDRDELVYVSAVVKEIFRMHQPLPLGLPHATSEDDIYDGYFIPKGTIVMGNSWQILHDARNFSDPFLFDPERFIKDGRLDKNVLDPLGPVFGYGRRICAGKHFSVDGVYAMVASILAVFDIIAPEDEHGNSTLELRVTDGIVVTPEPFDCIIAPRSPKHVALIRSLTVSE